MKKFSIKAFLYSFQSVILLFVALFQLTFSLSASADAAFDQCVADVGDANGWNDPADYTSLDCPNAGISSAGDLGQFANLGKLVLEGNSLTTLDVSGNAAIFHLNVNGNSLTSLNISGNTNLSVLLAANNSLTGLDTSSNTALAVLSLGNNNISSLDLSGNTNLGKLYVHNNSLNTLDITNNQGISEMTAGNNGLTSITLGPSGSLQTLGLANNNLTTLDIRGHGAMSYLNVQGNPLDTEAAELLKAIAEEQNDAGNDFTLLIDEDAGSETIEISDAKFDQCLNETGDANGWNTAEDFTSLSCPDAGITDVGELFHFTNLQTLDLSGNSISTINVSANGSLFSLNLNNNSLSSLDISQNTNLSVLQAAGNQLSSLDTGNNDKLSVLNVGDNGIGALDLSSNTQLGKVYVHENALTSLDISANSGITELVAGKNSLGSITLGNGSLELLGLEGNQLVSIDITGHGGLSYVNVRANPLSEDAVDTLIALRDEAVDEGREFTLLINVPPSDPAPEAVKINTVGGAARAAEMRLGAYASNGEATYGTTFTAGDFVTIAGQVSPDPVDVGLDGEIYAAMLSVVGGQSSITYLNEDGIFVPWDGVISNLGPAAIATPLEASHEITLSEGTLQSGVHKITLAYKANGGPLVFMKPITVKVSP